MNISSVSGGSNRYLSTYADNEIRMLDKQKEQLKKQIQTTKESDMDPKSKQEAIKLLQEQIRQIETEILQKRNDNLTGKTDADSNDQNSSGTASGNPGGSETESDLNSLNDLVAASSSLSKVRIIDRTKNSLSGKGNILAKEIETDEARGIDPKAKRAQLTDIKVHGQMLDHKMGEALKTSQGQAEDAIQADNLSNSNEPGKEADGDTEENDPLTWFLENGDQYKKVDVLA